MFYKWLVSIVCLVIFSGSIVFAESTAFVESPEKVYYNFFKALNAQNKEKALSLLYNPPGIYQEKEIEHLNIMLDHFKSHPQEMPDILDMYIKNKISVLLVKLTKEKGNKNVVQYHVLPMFLDGDFWKMCGWYWSKSEKSYDEVKADYQAIRTRAENKIVELKDADGYYAKTDVLIPITIEPEEGSEKTMDFYVKSYINFKIRIGHSDDSLAVGFGFINRTDKEYFFNYKVLFYNKEQEKLFEVSYDSSELTGVSKPGPGRMLSAPGRPDITCTSNEVTTIAYMKIIYRESN